MFVGSFQVRSINGVRLDVGKIRLCEGRKIRNKYNTILIYKKLRRLERQHLDQRVYLLASSCVHYEYRSNKRG